jgi:hypothetical protein
MQAIRPRPAETGRECVNSDRNPALNGGSALLGSMPNPQNGAGLLKIPSVDGELKTMIAM